MQRLSKFSRTFNPTDLIAVITIVGGFILMSFHIDTVVGGITTMVAAYYFGTRTTRGK